jgi:D-alanyl-lipoteichoic acid acyltransferase DltB (MBOAT superfamily)
MLFHSPDFIFAFFPTVLLGYWLITRHLSPRLAKVWLLLSSLFFYAWWNVNYLPLLLTSILVNYFVGNLMMNGVAAKEKLAILWFGISFNLLLLFYYKYADFFIWNVNAVTDFSISPLRPVLPLAISFFTFQQIAYIVDCYHQEVKEKGLINYALFVSFFPQLIAGPIVHHQQVIPQFEEKSRQKYHARNVLAGSFLFLIGMAKKSVLADPMTPYIDSAFLNVENINFLTAWISSLGFTFQLYFDYSGYADMAVGLALMFNIKLPFNFNSPLKAVNIADFWERWNITLINFMRRYVYIPLGGNRGGSLKQDRNLAAVFMLSGLWHGAGWTFVVWGVAHSFCNIAFRHWRNAGLSMPTFFGWFLTFNFINVICIIFRAESLNDVYLFLVAMLDFSSLYEPHFFVDFEGKQSIDTVFLLQVILCALIVFVPKINSNTLVENYVQSPKYAVAFGLLIFINLLFISNGPQEFVYFNF